MTETLVVFDSVKVQLLENRYFGSSVAHCACLKPVQGKVILFYNFMIKY